MSELLLQADAGLTSSIVAFVISLLIGAIGIHIGATLIIDRDVGFGRAVFTALVGALVWALVSFFLGWIPLLGPLLAVIAWIGVINWQYPGGWFAAAAVGVIAVIASAVVLWLLGTFLGVGMDALGVPGA
ncbi:hypothetical protein ACFQPA_06065 [Halomarina halobia]|uniref:Major facilitator superfamily (MFS) profile domain-containing protein n=1 Tax=Halomarina halobia TaxID=3033386 RepID=A0ABD6A7L9_9EURY|nr:hypothetical protein [Halomarina sp. PSR21]